MALILGLVVSSRAGNLIKHEFEAYRDGKINTDCKKSVWLQRF